MRGIQNLICWVLPTTVGIVLVAACASGESQDGSIGSGGGGTDAGVSGDADTLFPDGAAFDADSPPPGFFILVTETPAGTPDASAWGGILRYDIASNGAPAVQGIAINKSLVRDPVGLAFRKKSAEVFVGNRHGGMAADDVVGSISRFLYDAKTQSFSPNGNITGNKIGAVVQIAFSPAEDDLFVASYTGGDGITRFTLDSKGNVAPAGTLCEPGSFLGVAVSPDGGRLYATQSTNSVGPTNVIRQFDLSTGIELVEVSVNGASELHLMAISGTDLYVGDPVAGKAFRFTIDAFGNLSPAGTIDANHPISVALSPDGLELFTAGHQSAANPVIDRFMQSNAGMWTKTVDSIMAPSSLGGTLVFSKAAVPTEPL